MVNRLRKSTIRRARVIPSKVSGAMRASAAMASPMMMNSRSTDDDQINFQVQQYPELIEHAKVGIDSRVRFHGGELDEQIQIARVRLEVLAQRRAKRVKAANSITSTTTPELLISCCLPPRRRARYLTPGFFSQLDLGRECQSNTDTAGDRQTLATNSTIEHALRRNPAAVRILSAPLS